MLQNTEHINHIFAILFGVILLIIITSVFLFITFNNRKNKLIQEQLETKLASQKRLHELELNALRSQMNPHFVHNSLNAIQYYIQLNDVEKSEDYLAKFSKLMRLFFEYSRKNSITLNNELKLLKNYLDIEKMRFEDNLNFSLSIDTRLDVDAILIPPMILQPLLENAINHGVFHKQGKGLIEVLFSYKDDQTFEVQVLDNGIGIEKSKQLKTKQTATHTEHSGYVLEERLALLKQSKQWDIDFKIEDRKHLKENTSGTKVTLVFKDTEHDH